ncbi:MAG: hypothetical protein JW720_14085 [Sedimentisphaerales bacterium]|nr:hypothetical protein [Sedimentisphaerales bacterium]
MKLQNHKTRSTSARPGLTIAELMVAMVIVLIVILALGTAIADGVRGWHRAYEKVYADVVTDSYAARKAFDRVVRNATRHLYQIDPEGNWLEVYYYSTSTAPIVDRYARLYSTNGIFLIEHGSWVPGSTNPKTRLRTEIVCMNVSSCVFKSQGHSAQMVLTLDDGSQDIVVVTSAVMHNGS